MAAKLEMSDTEKQFVLESLTELFSSLDLLDNDYLFASGTKGDTPWVVFFARKDIVPKAVKKLDKLVAKHDEV